MRRSGKLLAAMFEQLRGMIQPGVMSIDLDRTAETFIRDNGAGFDLAHTIANALPVGNLGLLGMRKRAEMLGGGLEVGAINEPLSVRFLHESQITGDHEEVHDSLRRMQHDITLWQPQFFHLNEMGWVSGMTALFDVLGTVPGPKKVVFFSAMADTPLHLEFRELAAQAAVSRCSVYRRVLRRSTGW